MPYCARRAAERAEGSRVRGFSVTRRVLGRLGPIVLLAALLVPAAATEAASPTVEPPGASSPIAGAQRPATESGRKIALGLSMDPEKSDTSWQTILNMKTKTGRFPALWSVWSTWGQDSTKEFPGSKLDPNKSANKMFMANLKTNHIT